MIVFLAAVTVQTVTVCVRRLVTTVRHNTAFTHTAFRYVHITTTAAALLVFALTALPAPGEAVAPGIVPCCAGAP